MVRGRDPWGRRARCVPPATAGRPRVLAGRGAPHSGSGHLRVRVAASILELGWVARGLPSLSACALLSMVACAPEDLDVDKAEAPPLAALPGVAASGASGIDTIEVALLEYVIGVPRVLPEGRHALRLSNQGLEIHNLRLLETGGDSVLWQTDADMSPGQSRVFEVDFEPGSYTLLCDVAGHDTRGMTVTIEVEPTDSGSGPTSGGNDDGPDSSTPRSGGRGQRAEAAIAFLSRDEACDWRPPSR